MTRFTHCVVHFSETKHFSVLDRRTIINEKISVGKTIFVEFPVRKEPFEAIIKAICESKAEAEKKAQFFCDGGNSDSNELQFHEEENRSCSWSPEPAPIKDDQNNESKDLTRNAKNFVTSDLFCDVMNRVVEVLQGIQTSSENNLKECIKEMTKINQNLMSGPAPPSQEEEIDESSQKHEETLISTTTTTSSSKATPAISSSSKAASTSSAQKTPATNVSQIPKIVVSRPQANGNGMGRMASGWPPPPPPPPLLPSQAPAEDDHAGPSWEFVSREKVDEVFEDCENYKIFARKISYAIFDSDEQKLKMNERNKKKVIELRRIIKLKYPSERREFDDMIWRNCKNAVNNTTYNEAKRRKRHSALMLGTEATSQNFLSSNYELTTTSTTTSMDTTPPSKKQFDIPGHQESSSYFKAEPQSEMGL